MSCDSIRGEWGQPCPDCGAVLPDLPPPLTSWMARKMNPSQQERGRQGKSRGKALVITRRVSEGRPPRQRKHPRVVEMTPEQVEAQRAQSRSYYERNRELVLMRRREAYALRRAAEALG